MMALSRPFLVFIVLVGLVVPSTARDSDTVCRGAASDLDSSLLGERQELVGNELGRVGHAIECYALDEHSYPGPSSGLRTFEYLTSFLSPTYVSTLLVTDVWGNEYLYWSDGVNYALISYGSDRAPDLDYSAALGERWEVAREEICKGESHDTASDIVFVNGNHCSWYRAKRE
jgi:hypothetical protein